MRQYVPAVRPLRDELILFAPTPQAARRSPLRFSWEHSVPRLRSGPRHGPQPHGVQGVRNYWPGISFVGWVEDWVIVRKLHTQSAASASKVASGVSLKSGILTVDLREL